MGAYIYTITGNVAATVTLGTTPYIGPLTITNTGAIFPTGVGENGLVIVPPTLGNNNRLLNQGAITGGTGQTGLDGHEGHYGVPGRNNYNGQGYGYPGYAGGTGYSGYTGYAAGYGVNITAGASISNTGVINGGAGGSGGTGGRGGAGGQGGTGGPGYYGYYGSYEAGAGGFGGMGGPGGQGGSGGAGNSGINITAAQVTITNAGDIYGGAGGSGAQGGQGGQGGAGGHGGGNGAGPSGMQGQNGYGGIGGQGGLGGAGITAGAAGNPLGDTITNTHRIEGGSGGVGGLDAGYPTAQSGAAGGTGGAGIVAYGLQISNLGGAPNAGIFGGSGGNGSQGFIDAGGAGGAGGVGVYIASGASLLNNALIQGGSGGYGAYGGYGGNGGNGGIGLVMGQGTNTLVNNSYVVGGYGGGSVGAGYGKLGAGLSVTGTAVITNSGLIEGGVGLAAGAARLILTNYDAIKAASGGLGTDGGYGLAAGAGSYVYNKAGAMISGGAPGASGGTYGAGVILNGATLVNAGTIAGGYNHPPGHSYNAVSFGAAGGLLVVEPGAVFIGNVAGETAGTGPSVLELAGTARSTITSFGTSFSGFSTLSFATGARWDVQGSQLGLAGGIAIDGFALGDTLDVADFTISALTYVSGTGVVASNGIRNITLDVSGTFDHGFSYAADGNGGTLVEVAICYLRGTRILTPYGYRRIEELCAGDAVVTKFGGVKPVKWIGRQCFDARFLRNAISQLPVRIRAGALGEGLPCRDLWVSGGHSVLLDDTLVLAHALVNGITITQEFSGESIEYFHLECGAHDCVMAEDIWAESFADGPGLRAQFHNAQEFWAANPGYEVPDEVALCAPRPQRGPELAKALAPVVARAMAGRNLGRLQGYVEEVGAQLRGWAWDDANTYAPVRLEILRQGRFWTEVLACDPRGDLAAGGYGLGQCGFCVRLPAGVTPEEITVRRMADGAVLAFTHELRGEAAA